MDGTIGISSANMEATAYMKVMQAPARKFSPEYVQNAIEHGATVVKFSREKHSGVEKLRITNNGEGLTAPQMDKYLGDLFSSSKVTAADANRGIGARVTGLRISPAGVVYTSAMAGGREYELDLWVDEDARVLRKHGRYTGQVSDEDFVSTLFIGTDEDSPTGVRPYEGANMESLVRDLIDTYFRMPIRVEVRGAPGKAHKMQVLTDALTPTSVKAGGVTYHWFDVEGRLSDTSQIVLSGHVTSMPTCGGLVYQNRIFDLSRGKELWARQASKMGLGLVSDSVMLFIEFDDSYGVAPDEMRRHLTYMSTLNAFAIVSDEVRMEHYAEASTGHRPAWVENRIEEARKKLSAQPDLREQLREITKKYKVMFDQHRPQAEGDDECGTESGGGMFYHENGAIKKKRKKRSKRDVPGDKPARKMNVPLDMIPNVEFVYDMPETFQDPQCVMDSQALFAGYDCMLRINMDTPVFRELYTSISEASGVECQHVVEQLISQECLLPYWAALVVAGRASGKGDSEFRQDSAGLRHEGLTAGAIRLTPKQLKEVVKRAQEVAGVK